VKEIKALLSGVLLLAYVGMALIMSMQGKALDFLVNWIVLFGVMGMIIIRFYNKNIGPLIMTFITLCFLPFIHLVTYPFFDFTKYSPIVWGLASNKYMFNHEIVNYTLQIGAIMISGLYLGSISISSNNNLEIIPHKELGKIKFTVLLCLGLFFSLISTPAQTVFEAQYATTTTNIIPVNFSSGWMVSYAILTLLFVDAFLSKSGLKQFKRTLIILVIIYVVFWLQFMRGDRESIPWVGGLLWIYISKLKPGISRKKLILPLITVGLIVLANQIVGAVRSNLTGLSIMDAYSLIEKIFISEQGENLILLNFLHGTWSAVLLTPLSVAGDHILFGAKYLYGMDYMNLILSLPPGFIADFFGYVRPLEYSQGPSWDMRFGLGGTHFSVVPFRNFGLFGVFVFSLVQSRILFLLIRYLRRKNTIFSIAVFGFLFSVLPHWLWYGDKYIINAIIIILFLQFIYKFRIA
jgi:hypothetical protein